MKFSTLENTIGYNIISKWLHNKGLNPFYFQQQIWQHIIHGKSGLVNAPTGCGKTYSVFLGAVIQFINKNPNTYQTQKNNGLQLLWISPLRALATDIGKAMQQALHELNIPWKVAIRNGDTSTAERQKQKKQTPEILIITPESLHLLFAQKQHEQVFETVQVIAVDEWHELLGSKRGVQVELAIGHLIHLKKQSNNLPGIWGISATIGNLAEAMDVLLHSLNNLSSPFDQPNHELVVAQLSKQIEVKPIIPDEIEKYPWAGHLGLKLAQEVIPIIHNSNTTLIFINTRGMSERWYQTILDVAPELAGAIALHHGSIEKEIREWIEEALHNQKLKAVICTASLDLGVDFRPVDTVIQVGSPKGVSRFLQRAGRSGHAPGEVSKIYFLPTHSLELVEVAALKKAIDLKEAESKPPLFLCFDVLLQYLCTIAIGGGFKPDELFNEIQSTFCFSEISKEEWQEVLLHLTLGGKALQQYDEYKKIEIDNGLYVIKNRRIAFRHRLHIGTIVSDAMMKVKLANGKYLGVIEEYFITQLDEGDAFTFAGRNLELVTIKEMTVLTKPTKTKKTKVPSWMGGRMSLTANLGKLLRETFDEINELVTIDKTPKIKNQNPNTSIFSGETKQRETKNHKPETINYKPELQALQPLFLLQSQLSHLPKSAEILIEKIEAEDGYHLVVYPFEGRQIHEAMSALLAYRITQLEKNSFSIAMNDYGFELYSDKPVTLSNEQLFSLFATQNLYTDILHSVNNVEMAKRKFRDIAVIGGLIFQGMPGEAKKARHLQSSASLIFKVLSEYDADNILLKQAYQEVLDQQMEEARLRAALQRITQSKLIVTTPAQFTPLSFPIIVDGLNRNNLSNETLEERIKAMQQRLN